MSSRSWVLFNVWVAAVVFSPPAALFAADDYPPHPDSLVQPGVPTGDLIKFELTSAGIFPGTSREVTVYVPKQYDPAHPACVYVNQDGVQWNAPVVFDNLIARGDIPVLVGVFIRPGVVKPLDPERALPRFNRSLEYDGLGDDYARFVLEEVLPAVEGKTTPDGRAIRLSKSGNDRAIGGSSSGAIAAFTAAWERPEAFSRVFSAIGTYVGLRGGDGYATLIRKFEPKPLRIFLQGGSQDNNIYAGDWWMANQMLERALTFAGYDVSHVWGEGGHNGRHATSLFPDAMRWLWRAWPTPIEVVAPTRNAFLKEILIPGETWEIVSEGHQSTRAVAVNGVGEVFFTDAGAGKSFFISKEGKVKEVSSSVGPGGGQQFGKNGRRYSVSRETGQVIAYPAGAASEVVAEGLFGRDLAVTHSGNLYVIASNASGRDESRIWLLRPDGNRVAMTFAVRSPGGMALSPDQSLLYITDRDSKWVYSYQLQLDGTLAHEQRYGWLHVLDTEAAGGIKGVCCDREGRVYVGTQMGIQICDQAGRVNAILPIPDRRATQLTFGGESFDSIYAVGADKVYRRKVRAQGVLSFAAPVKPAPPRL
ncbi:MAG TPA: SMP-30/gluconolactonase/LRE family protein [Opitutaceae bacterium]|nr:SMP-30/gluconolactonase/LRE family protein [Opitutaceae bacterium]